MYENTDKGWKSRETSSQSSRWQVTENELFCLNNDIMFRHSDMVSRYNELIISSYVIV